VGSEAGFLYGRCGGSSRLLWASLSSVSIIMAGHPSQFVIVVNGQCGCRRLLGLLFRSGFLSGRGENQSRSKRRGRDRDACTCFDCLTSLSSLLYVVVVVVLGLVVLGARRPWGSSFSGFVVIVSAWDLLQLRQGQGQAEGRRHRGRGCRLVAGSKVEHERSLN
jgi:hypothetical protein